MLNLLAASAQSLEQPFLGIMSHHLRLGGLQCDHSGAAFWMPTRINNCEVVLWRKPFRQGLPFVKENISPMQWNYLLHDMHFLLVFLL